MNSDRMGPESKEETLWGLDTEKKEEKRKYFLWLK